MYPTCQHPGVSEVTSSLSLLSYVCHAARKQATCCQRSLIAKRFNFSKTGLLYLCCKRMWQASRKGHTDKSMHAASSQTPMAADGQRDVCA